MPLCSLNCESTGSEILSRNNTRYQELDMSVPTHLKVMEALADKLKFEKPKFGLQMAKEHAILIYSGF
jgi:hypothetical protein